MDMVNARTLSPRKASVFASRAYIRQRSADWECYGPGILANPTNIEATDQ